MKPPYIFVALFFGLLIFASLLGKLPAWIPVVYLVLSVITFFTYGLDKSASQSDSWRTSEKTLHILGIIGGWPGGLLAQQAFRHKTAKKRFQMVFWFIVIVNSLFISWLALSGLIANRYADQPFLNLNTVGLAVTHSNRLKLGFWLEQFGDPDHGYGLGVG